jgi:hypothetical protein
MEVQPDFRELLELLNSHGVKFLVVGGYALAFYGSPRFTGDIDIFVQPSPANARRVMKALKDFGFGSVGLSESDFMADDRVIQLGVPPVRVDFLTSLTGVSWDEASKDMIKGMFGDVPVHYLGRKQFTANKRALGRKKDLADLEALGE